MAKTERLFERIMPLKTADEVVLKIEQLLLDGVLRDGEKLPGERDLAAQFEVSRPILRDALKELEARGLLESQHGGGTYVADIIGQIFSKPVTDLIARHERATLDYLEYRRELEGLTAEMAARRATETDTAILRGIIAEMRKAHDAEDFDAELDADVELHNAIGESAHNIILLHTLRACYRLMSAGIFYHRNLIFTLPHAREKLLEQHEAIVEAIASRKPDEARRAAEGHIDFVTIAMQQAKRAGEWDHVSRQRLENRKIMKADRKTG